MSLISQSEDTIAAIATAIAAGQGGIAIIRISGPAAIEIGKKVVSIPGEAPAWSSHQVLYGYVMDETGKERIDEVLVLNMKAPRSFTGEDIVEIHCHGGLIAVQRVLERVIEELLANNFFKKCNTHALLNFWSQVVGQQLPTTANNRQQQQTAFTSRVVALKEL